MTETTETPGAIELGQRYAIVSAFKAYVDAEHAAAKQAIDDALLAAHEATGLDPEIPIQLPGVDKAGTMSRTPNPDRIDPVDMDALSAYVVEHYGAGEVVYQLEATITDPDVAQMVRDLLDGFDDVKYTVTPTPRKTTLDKLMKSWLETANFEAGTVIDIVHLKKTGEVLEVPGVKPVKGEGFKAVSFRGQQAMFPQIIERLRDRTLPLELLAAPEPEPAAEPEVVVLPTPEEVRNSKKVPAARVRELATMLGIEQTSVQKLRGQVAAALETGQQVAA